jgi:lycopene cyclase domain-containing protein
MTYFQFLGLFIIVPMFILAWVQRRQINRRQVIVIGSLALVAVLYTTIWDNYLVANRIWWYEPDQVAGITLGWVPVEEYLFFILESILVGLWLLFLWERIPVGRNLSPASLRWIAPLGLGITWIILAIILFVGWEPGRYLALELVWALPPIMLQLAYGADLLWKEKRLVGLAILSATIYFSAADWIAIRAGIWTINPRFTLKLNLSGILPIEEVLFFFLTTVLVVFGVYLALSSESKTRFGGYIRRGLIKEVSEEDF